MENASVASAAVSLIVDNGPGRYIYGIAPGGETERFGPIGIENSQVYSIPYRDVCAVVHDCGVKPYDSLDEEMVRFWVEAHHGVIEAVKKRFGTVIPLGFDTIIRSRGDGARAEMVVTDWLRNEYDKLIATIENIKGKDEYGVQILLDCQLARKAVVEKSPEAVRIQTEIPGRSAGMAYLWKQKLEKVIKCELEKLADKSSVDFYQAITGCADQVVIERADALSKDKLTVLNLSCLVDQARVEKLGQELEKINSLDGFSVRFSGPWPPYSFVTRPSQVPGGN
jgi:hypothetical protein